MGVERIIGIDFGTSTSVIRVKRYQDGAPVGDPLEVKQITFDMGSSMVPTLVQKRDNGETVFFGHDASISHKGTKTFSNFKVDLENPDGNKRRQAKELTSEFFAYMAKVYKSQSEGGHLGESTDVERTIISYPVKWSEETKTFMRETAKAAGFPNVEGLDEARAAIQAVTVQNADMLSKKGYFKDSVPTTILLIDMGAGTTDLVLCRHTPGTAPKTEILCTWPQSGKVLFGGSEVDKILCKMISDCLPEDSVDMILRKLNNEKFKAWKERNISPALSKRETVEEFSALDDITDMLDIEVSYSINRENFETAAKEYLQEFPKLVNNCLRCGKIAGDNIDLVILTGGHSQWYFVQEMLQGTMTQFGAIALDKIQKDTDRIVPITLPQETVALGLVYGKLIPSVNQLKARPAAPQKNVSLPTVQEKEHKPVVEEQTKKIVGTDIKETVENITTKVENIDWKSTADNFSGSIRSTIGNISDNFRSAVTNFNLNRGNNTSQKQSTVKNNSNDNANNNTLDEETLRQYTLMAERGNVDAQYNLGECYYSGNGTKKDINEAIRWYMSAANQGHSDAQFRLGECYNTGIGVTVNGSEAAKWYKMAAEQGHPEGQCKLGDCYYYGNGVNKNDDEAEKWYKMAANRGNDDAKKQLEIAFAYITIKRVFRVFTNRLGNLIVEIDGTRYSSISNAPDNTVRVEPGLHSIRIGKKTMFGDDLQRHKPQELSIARGDHIEIAIDGGSANVNVFLNKNIIKSWNVLRD
mgnify:FL=1